jgi:hypothetical protein
MILAVLGAKKRTVPMPLRLFRISCCAGRGVRWSFRKKKEAVSWGKPKHPRLLAGNRASGKDSAGCYSVFPRPSSRSFVPSCPRAVRLFELRQTENGERLGKVVSHRSHRRGEAGRRQTAQNVDDAVAQRCHYLRSYTLAHAAGVLAHRHVTLVMQSVFDPPVPPASGRATVRGWHVRGGAQRGRAGHKGDGHV